MQLLPVPGCDDAQLSLFASFLLHCRLLDLGQHSAREAVPGPRDHREVGPGVPTKFKRKTWAHRHSKSEQFLLLKLVAVMPELHDWIDELLPFWQVQKRDQLP